MPITLRTDALAAVDGDKENLVVEISDRLESIIEKGTRKKKKEIDKEE